MGSMIEPLICPSLVRGIGNTRVPADNGIFFGHFDSQSSRLVLTAFIDSAKLWDEEIFALGQL